MRIGIDFGTCFSYVSTCIGSGSLISLLGNNPRIRDDNNGIPTVFYYEMSTGVKIGVEARELTSRSPQNGKTYIKRDYLRRGRLAENIPLGGVKYSTKTIVVKTLEFLIKNATDCFKKEHTNEYSKSPKLEGLVIAVPARNESYKKFIKECGVEASGLNCDDVKLIEEPVAVALNYLSSNKNIKFNNGSRVLVFDLGGGTVDVAVLEYSKSHKYKFEVLKPSGNTDYGGIDWDERLAEIILDENRPNKPEINEEYAFDLDVIKKKIELSSFDNVKFSHTTESGMHLKKSKITRNEFNECSDDLLRLVMNLAKDTVEKCPNKEKKIDKIILSGGASQMPMIAEGLKHEFPGVIIEPPIMTASSVSFGAAIAAKTSPPPPLRKVALFAFLAASLAVLAWLGFNAFFDVNEKGYPYGIESSVEGEAIDEEDSNLNLVLESDTMQDSTLDTEPNSVSGHTQDTEPDNVSEHTQDTEPDNAPVLSVVSITGVPLSATTGTSLPLTGTVNPATDRTITWSVVSAGGTGASISGNNFNATAPGTATIRATIANGSAIGTAFTQDFNVTVVAAFVPVTHITGVPSSATAGTSLFLSGTINPTNSTSRTITWSVVSAGGTGASISGNNFNATASGTATIRATIANGSAVGIPFTQDFQITMASVLPTFVTLNTHSVLLAVGESATLTADVHPFNASDRSVTWSSSHPHIVSVNNGVITAHMFDGSVLGHNFMGTTGVEITATTTNGLATSAFVYTPQHILRSFFHGEQEYLVTFSETGSHSSAWSLARRLTGRGDFTWFNQTTSAQGFGISLSSNMEVHRMGNMLYFLALSGPMERRIAVMNLDTETVTFIGPTNVNTFVTDGSSLFVMTHSEDGMQLLRTNLNGHTVQVLQTFNFGENDSSMPRVSSLLPWNGVFQPARMWYSSGWIHFTSVRETVYAIRSDGTGLHATS